MLLRITAIVLLLELIGQGYQQINLEFLQNDYNVTFERIQVLRFNRAYMHYFKAVTFKYNRTCAAFNMTFKYKKAVVFENVGVIFQAYKFTSNEYRVFPIRFQLQYCDIFDKQLGGSGNYSGCSNFQGCPLVKEKHYQICSFTPDQSKLPPLIPNGRYKIESQALIHKIEVWIVHYWMEIHRSLVGK